MNFHHLIFLILLFSSCTYSKNRKAIKYLNPKLESEKFISKLTKIEVDSILVYSKNCSGCIPGLENPYYVYWVKNSKANLMKFTEYSNYKSIKVNYVLPYFTRPLLDSLESEKLNSPTIWMSHYTTEIITIYLKSKNVSYKIDLNEKGVENKEKKQLRILKKISSMISEIESSKWKAKNIKLRKKTVIMDDFFIK